MNIRIPVERNEGNVEPIENDANQSQYGGNFNDIQTSVPEAKGKHQTWYQHETKHFHQIPVAPRSEEHTSELQSP